MKIYHIVWLMLITLAFLFILTPIFRRKEQEKNAIEREYFSLIKKELNSEEISQELKEAAKKIHPANKIDTDEKLVAQINQDKMMMG